MVSFGLSRGIIHSICILNIIIDASQDYGSTVKRGAKCFCLMLVIAKGQALLREVNIKGPFPGMVAKVQWLSAGTRKEPEHGGWEGYKTVAFPAKTWP